MALKASASRRRAAARRELRYRPAGVVTTAATGRLLCHGRERRPSYFRALASAWKHASNPAPRALRSPPRPAHPSRTIASPISGLAGSPEIGPTAMRASTLLENGSEEHVDVATQAHAGAGRSQAERGRPAAERGAGAAGGAQASGDRRGDLSPVAESVRRDEGRRREAAEGARGRESEAEADRRGSGSGHSGG